MAYDDHDALTRRAKAVKNFVTEILPISSEKQSLYIGQKADGGQTPSTLNANGASIS